MRTSAGWCWQTTRAALSGPAVRPVALRMVWQSAKKVHIPIIGMGGIETGEDAAAFMLCGAKAVMVGTANFTDPFACPRIIRELDALLRRGRRCRVRRSWSERWRKYPSITGAFAHKNNPRRPSTARVILFNSTYRKLCKIAPCEQNLDALQTSAEVKTSRFLSGFAQFVVHALRDVIERIGDVVALSVDFPLDAGNVAAQSLLPGLEAVKVIPHVLQLGVYGGQAGFHLIRS